MNGLNSVGGGAGTGAVSGPAQAGASDFDAVFEQGVANMTAVLFQFIGGDILQTVLRGEESVD